jgi:hypothetical protein
MYVDVVNFYRMQMDLRRQSSVDPSSSSLELKRKESLVFTAKKSPLDKGTSAIA